jgi:PAS domain S-box-containing protein
MARGNMSEAQSGDSRDRTQAKAQPILTCQFLAGGEITHVNEAYCEYFDKTPEELVGQSFLSLIPEEDRERVKANISRLSADLPAQAHEHRVIRPDGQIGWQRWTNGVLLDAQGQIVGYQAIGEDITERKRAEDALVTSEKNYRELFDLCTEAIFVHEVTTARILDVNRTTLEMFGYSYEEALSLRVEDLSLREPPYSQAVAEQRVREAAAGEPQTFEWRSKRKSGELFWSEVTLRRASIGGQDRILAFVRDITDRKRAEQERLSLQQQVHHAQKLESLGLLAGGVAHDFNNLLATILGNATLALDELSPGSPVRHNLEAIAKACRRAADLARQMLDYSGRGQFVIEPIDTAKLVEEMGHRLDVSVSKKAALEYDLGENLPAFDGDPTQIRQVILNLITNATEAIGNEGGVITLSAGAMHCDRAYLGDAVENLRSGLDKPPSEGLYVYLEVADTGCGMETDAIRMIFDPFYTTKATGSGLGMSAVLGIVRGHGGVIKVHSEVGRGTAFRVLFPAS